MWPVSFLLKYCPVPGRVSESARNKCCHNESGLDGCSYLILFSGDVFDVASMQFALHYMGQTEGRMRRFLHEVSRHLRVGGVFIATTMDSRVLIQLLMGHAQQSWVS